MDADALATAASALGPEAEHGLDRETRRRSADRQEPGRIGIFAGEGTARWGAVRREFYPSKESGSK
jgi:hypothetical protein